MGFKWLRTGGIPNQVIPIYTSLEDVTIANSVAEATLLGAGNGSLITPGNTVEIGDRFDFSIQGRFSSVANPTIRLKIKLGATVLGDTGAIVIGNGTDEHWIITASAVIRSLGSTGTVMVSGSFVTSLNDHSRFINVVPIVIDTTIDNTVDVTAEWGTANASNSVTNQIALFTIIKSP